MENLKALNAIVPQRSPWNKGKLIGARPPLRPKHVWSIRTRVQLEDRKRDLALFNLAIDSKLRGCDLVSIMVEDVAPRSCCLDRATVRQKKTGHSAVITASAMATVERPEDEASSASLARLGSSCRGNSLARFMYAVTRGPSAENTLMAARMEDSRAGLVLEHRAVG